MSKNKIKKLKKENMSQLIKVFKSDPDDLSKTGKDRLLVLLLEERGEDLSKVR